MNEKQKLEKSLSIWDDAIVLQFLFLFHGNGLRQVPGLIRIEAL